MVTLKVSETIKLYHPVENFAFVLLFLLKIRQIFPVYKIPVLQKCAFVMLAPDLGPKEK